MEKKESVNQGLFWLSLWLSLRSDYRRLEKIAQVFSDIRQVFEVGEKELLALNLDKESCREILSGRSLERGEKVLKSFVEKGFWLMLQDDPDYPPLLREIAFPPFLLFGAGRKEILAQPSIAIVGTRRPSPYGRSMAEKLAADLAERGLIIVSGLARGIDSLAHEAALSHGQTVAVLGSGLKKIYPPENRSLFDRIVRSGAVISEYPPDEPPLAYHFPWRNRLISGLSLATLVIEASSKSGSLITARLALDQNREVMAVPGKVGSELSQGTNGLIKAGAKLVENWLDVVLELPSSVRDAILLKEKEQEINQQCQEMKALAEDEKMVLDFLPSEEIISLDELIFRSGRKAADLLAILLRLEMKGMILTYPGPGYQRRV